nr:unnamed protein product [Digitaria exilis]
MGALNGRNPSGVLDGLYGVELNRPLPQSAQSEDQALRTTALESSTCEHQKGGRVRQRLLIRRLWQQRPSCLKPIHCSITCDKHAGETIANVVTSLPFIVLGLQTPRKNLNTAIYANSLVGVGIASSLYHSSKGEIRKFLRWADYTMIATTTLVSFARRASIEPELRMAHNLHKMSSLLGGALFIADDCFPETPYIHAAWHLAAAIGIGTCNKLLE